jgi:hypothetical protein
MWLGAAAGLQLLAGSADMALPPGWRADAPLGPVVSDAAARAGSGAPPSRPCARSAAGQWIPTAPPPPPPRGLPFRSDRTFWSVHPLFLLQALVPVPSRDEPRPDALSARSSRASRSCSRSTLPAAASWPPRPPIAARRGDGTRWGLAGGGRALGRYTPAYHFFTVVFPPSSRAPSHESHGAVALFWAVLAAWARGLPPRRPGGASRSSRPSSGAAGWPWRRCAGGPAVARRVGGASGRGDARGGSSPWPPAGCATGHSRLPRGVVAMAQRRVRLPMATQSPVVWWRTRRRMLVSTSPPHAR